MENVASYGIGIAADLGDNKHVEKATTWEEAAIYTKRERKNTFE